MLYQGYCGVHSYGIFSRNVSSGIKTIGECIFRAIMSLTSAVVKWSCEIGTVCFMVLKGGYWLFMVLKW